MSGTRAKKQGISAEAEKKIASKYPKEWEADAMAWVASVSGVAVEWGTGDEARMGDNFAKPLRDGAILCKVVNNLFPNSIKKIHEQNPNAFKMQENISNFLKACEANGVDSVHMFQTVDLYEKQNVGQANKKDPSKPLFGPKQAEECKREFTEEQLREAAIKAH